MTIVALTAFNVLAFATTNDDPSEAMFIRRATLREALASAARRGNRHVRDSLTAEMDAELMRILLEDE